MNKIDEVRLLDSMRLFNVLSAEQRQSLLNSSNRTSLSKDECLFNVGDKANHFYLLTEGQIKICLNSMHGMEKVIAVFRPSDLFAEAVMFLPEKRYPVTCIALQKSEVIGFDMNQFTGFVHQSNDLSFALLHDLSQRLHQKIGEIESLAFQNANMRVGNYIYSLIPDRNASSARVKFDTPKQTIASIVSTTPETFSRVLAQLKLKGLLVLEDNTIYIPDTNKLREYLFAAQ